MKFSSMMISDAYRPNPTAAADNKEEAVQRLVVRAHNDFKKAVLDGHLQTSRDRSSLDLNDLMVELDGAPFTRKQRDIKDDEGNVLEEGQYEVTPKVVEDFNFDMEDPDTAEWIRNYFDGKRSYGPRAPAARRQSSESSEEYKALQQSVQDAFEVAGKKNPSKEDLHDALVDLLRDYTGFAVKLNALKGTLPDDVLEGDVPF